MNLPRTFCIARRSDLQGIHQTKNCAPTKQRWSETEKHLLSEGIVAEVFWGIEWQVSGIETRFTYELDHPGSGYKTHSASICNLLSQFFLWRLCAHFPDDEFLILEDDVRFLKDWRTGYINARSSVPADWDMLFIGSCCCQGKPKKLVAGNVYSLQWPFCTHAYLVRKKALPILDETMQKFYAPIDIALTLHAFPKLKVYTVLPRIVEQFETKLAP